MILDLLLAVFFDAPASIHMRDYLDHPYFETAGLPRSPDFTSRGQGNLTHVVYGFLPYWRTNYTDRIRLAWVSHVAWFGIELSSTGEVVERNGWPDDWIGFKEDVQAGGARFDLVVILFDWSGAKIHELIANPLNRGAAVSNILKESTGCDGVNLDFEIPSAADRDLFADFVHELADSLHERQMTLTVDVTGVNWSNRFDVARITGYADYLFIMGYDYHYSGSTQSGPVAPLQGETYNVTRSVEDYVGESNGHPERIVLGVPYYGYDWPVADTFPYSTTAGTGTAYIYASAAASALEHGLRWHEATSSPWYHYGQVDDVRQCWFEDTSSLGLKYYLAKSRNLAGAGMWALTYDAEREELWNLLTEEFGTGVAEDEPGENETFFDLPGLWPMTKLADYLRTNPGVELYDVTGRKLSSPAGGVIFLKSGNKTARIVVIP